jgi:hypothetical protein
MTLPARTGRRNEPARIGQHQRSHRIAARVFDCGSTANRTADDDGILDPEMLNHTTQQRGIPRRRQRLGVPSRASLPRPVDAHDPVPAGGARREHVEIGAATRDRMETDHGLSRALVIDGKIDAVDRYQRGAFWDSCFPSPHRPAPRHRTARPHPSRSAAADGSFHRNLIPISSYVNIYINIIMDDSALFVDKVAME